MRVSIYRYWLLVGKACAWPTNNQSTPAFFLQPFPTFGCWCSRRAKAKQNTSIGVNLMIEANVIHAAYINNVTKLLFLGSSCIYPKMAPQPIKEDDLLIGLLEQTNEPYAIVKIAGIKLCKTYWD